MTVICFVKIKTRHCDVLAVDTWGTKQWGKTTAAWTSGWRTHCTLLHTTSVQGRNKKCACKKLAFYVSGAVSQNIRSGSYSSLRRLHILICHGKMCSRVTLGRHQGDKSEGDEQWTDWLFVWICYSKPRLLSSHCELDNNTNTKVQEDDNSWFNRV